MGQEAAAAKLSELEEVLRRPDYVLEPRCISTIMAYIKAGGSPVTVIDFLQDGYVGTAQMASLVTGWLAAFTKGGDGAEGGSAGPTSTSSSQEPQDEFYFLKAFVAEHFSPERLTLSSRGVPAWVAGLIAEPRGRALVLALSAVHRNSMLLNYAISKIMDKGHESEVAKVGSSLAFHFTVFHRLMFLRLAAAVAAITLQPGSEGPPPSPPGATQQQLGPDASPRLRALAAELADTCATSEPAYLHTQQLLGLLACQASGGPAIQRLAQELQAAATASQPTAWAMMPMLLPPGSSHPALLEAAGLASKLLASFHPPPPSRPPPFTPFSSFLTLSQQPLTPVTLNAQDLVKLAGCVRREEGEGGGGAARLAPVIQHPALMQLLIAGTFVPGKVTNTDSRDAAIDILVAASTCPSSASCVHIPDDARSLLCEGLGLSRDECLVQQDAWCDQSAERVQAAEETRAALYSVLAVGAKAGARLTPEDAGAVQQIVRIPVAAAALLHYARFHLTNTDYYAEAAAASSGAPAYIRLALLVARVQPALAPQVVWLLACALEAQGSGRAELTGLTTGVLAHLMREGLCVGSVQEALGAWAQAADPSLVRHMIMQVLGCVSPPYSPPFARWLLDLMVRSNMKPRSAREGSVMGSAAAAAAAALTARGGGAAQAGDAGAGPVMSGAALLQEFAEVVLAMAGGGSAGANASRDARRMLQGGADALRRGAAGRGDLDASKQGARGKASAAMALTAKEVTLLQELAHGSAR